MNDQVILKPTIYAPATPVCTPVYPELAAEIGLNESITLVQLAHWIKRADHFIDGKWWTYQSVRKMQAEAFQYWSITTVNRNIHRLLQKGYIFEGNYNKRQGDETRWFALNVEALQQLKSIQIVNEPVIIKASKPVSKRDRVFQNETGVFQNGTPLFQNETTLPEKTPEKTPEKESAIAVAAAPPDETQSKTTDTVITPFAALQQALIDAMCEVGEWRRDSLPPKTTKSGKPASSGYYGLAGRIANQLLALQVPVTPDQALSLIRYVKASSADAGKKWNIFWLPNAVSDWRNANGFYVSKKKGEPQTSSKTDHVYTPKEVVTGPAGPLATPVTPSDPVDADVKAPPNLVDLAGQWLLNKNKQGTTFTQFIGGQS